MRLFFLDVHADMWGGGGEMFEWGRCEGRERGVRWGLGGGGSGGEAGEAWGACDAVCGMVVVCVCGC